MCTYITGDGLIPGIGCCHCRGYNGLQRKICRDCGQGFCAVEIPANVQRCSECGWGTDKPMTFTHTLAGRDVRGKCPACDAPWPTPSQPTPPA